MSQLSPNRAGKIGSSMIAALFGRSRWHTRLQLWASMRGEYRLDGISDERMEWGRLLQPLILAQTAKRKGWEIEPNEDENWVDHPDPTLRCGCTLDAWIRRHERGLGVVEVKCVDKDEWRGGGWAGGKPPAEVELQVQHQLFVTGAVWGAIAVLVGGNELQEPILREPKPRVHAAIEREVREFWREVEENRRPEPQAGDDYSVLAELLEDEEPGSPPRELLADIELGQACADFLIADQMRKEASAACDSARAKILARTGRAGVTLVPWHRVKVTKTAVPARTQQVKPYVQARISVEPDEALQPPPVHEGRWA